MELVLYFLRENAKQADTDRLGTCGDLFYVGAVTGWAMREGLRSGIGNTDRFRCLFFFVFYTVRISYSAKNGTIVSVFFSMLFTNNLSDFFIFHLRIFFFDFFIIVPELILPFNYNFLVSTTFTKRIRIIKHCVCMTTFGTGIIVYSAHLLFISVPIFITFYIVYHTIICKATTDFHSIWNGA